MQFYNAILQLNKIGDIYELVPGQYIVCRAESLRQNVIDSVAID